MGMQSGAGAAGPSCGGHNGPGGAGAETGQQTNAENMHKYAWNMHFICINMNESMKNAFNMHKYAHTLYILGMKEIERDKERWRD
jgi:hypothetical protein